MAREKRGRSDGSWVVEVVWVDMDDANYSYFTEKYPLTNVEAGQVDNGDGTYGSQAPTAAQVSTERDRRLAAGFTHRSHTFGLTNEETADIAAGVAKALQFVEDNKAWLDLVPAVDPGTSLRWLYPSDKNTDAVWPTKTSPFYLSMTADEMIELGKQAAEETSWIKRKSREISAMSPIPDDYDNDSRWT